MAIVVVAIVVCGHHGRPGWAAFCNNVTSCGCVWCLEPTPSLRIVEDADLVAAEVTQKTDATLSQQLSTDSSLAADTDALDLVCIT